MDYKAPLQNFRLKALISRRAVHICLTVVAVICLTLAIRPHQSNQLAYAETDSESANKPKQETTIISFANGKEMTTNLVNGLSATHLDPFDQKEAEEKESLPTSKNQDIFNLAEKSTKPNKTKSNDLNASQNTAQIEAKESKVTEPKNSGSKIADSKIAESKIKDQKASDAKKPEQKSESNTALYEAKNAKTDKANSDGKSNRETKDNQSQAKADSSQIKAESSQSKDSKTPKPAVALNWQTIKIQKNDTLAKVFQRHGFSAKDLQQMMSSDKAKPHLKSLQPGQTLKLQVKENKDVEGLNLELEPGKTLSVVRNESGTGYVVTQKDVPLEKKVAFGKGEIRASLISAARRAGLDNNIVAQLVEIYGGNIDFSSDLKPNDTFRVLFEQKCLPDGEKIKTGPVLAAEIVNGGKKIQAIRYTDNAGHTGYFSPEGNGLNQAFLRSPVNFAHVSSGFGMRLHPIYHKMKHHKGVDYKAPLGTPVQATGDAKVVFVGTKRGYGKTIELQHGARYTTLYAHLSRYAKNLKAGAEVKQGQVIGYVGKTGLATNYHLHYEFRIDGIHRNPLTVALPKAKLIASSNKKQFLAHAKEMIRLMDVHEQKVNVASIEFTVNE